MFRKRVQSIINIKELIQFFIIILTGVRLSIRNNWLNIPHIDSWQEKY